MKYGLAEHSLNILNTIFKKYTGITKVILYGSRAKGDFKNGSDIDITLEINETFRPIDLSRLMSDFEESDLPYFVDCSIFKNLQNENLKAHIRRVGCLLYEKT
jgi:predicted nucleotidyltransferase